MAGLSSTALPDREALQHFVTAGRIKQDKPHHSLVPVRGYDRTRDGKPEHV